MYNEIDLDKIDLQQEPPQEEPARQYYFMAKCREWVRDFQTENGRCPTFFIQTFGCQMNARDSEKIQGIMQMMRKQIQLRRIFCCLTPALSGRMPI